MKRIFYKIITYCRVICHQFFWYLLFCNLSEERFKHILILKKKHKLVGDSCNDRRARLLIMLHIWTYKLCNKILAYLVYRYSGNGAFDIFRLYFCLNVFSAPNCDTSHVGTFSFFNLRICIDYVHNTRTIWVLSTKHYREHTKILTWVLFT